MRRAFPPHAAAGAVRRLLGPRERPGLPGRAPETATAEQPCARDTRLLAAGILRQASGGDAGLGGPHLLVLTGPGAGARLPLGPEQTLGRSRRADLRLDDPGASRLHARVRIVTGGATVEDLGSKNGLRVNGVPLRARARPLRPGDQLQIGDTSLALVHREVPAAPAMPAAAHPAGGARVRPAPRRGAEARRAAAALLALSAIALALAGT